MLSVYDDLRFVKGIGEKRSQLYGKIGVHTVGDLIYYMPAEYIDLTKSYSPMEAEPGSICGVKAIVSAKTMPRKIRKNLSVSKITAVGDGGDSVHITFFNAEYTVKALEIGAEYIFYGTVAGNLISREMTSPRVFPVTEDIGLIPVYPQTAGLTSKMIGTNILSALSLVDSVPDCLPSEIRLRHRLMDIKTALYAVHHPKSAEEASRGKRRLIYEELFSFGISLNLMKKGRLKAVGPKMSEKDITPFYKSLPFTPTDDQINSINDIIADMQSGYPMNRLVEGDVGSGKTLVAAAAVYFSFLNGFQSAMMAPTEILAEQHYETLGKMLAPLGVKTVLLTGSVKAAEKRKIKALLASGEADLAVGTHALLTEDTEFKSLGLMITDEQHRFGVSQRMILAGKGSVSNTLVMSATPIPRTLGLILYGDMEVSKIKQMPKGRIPVESFFVGYDKRERAYNYVKKHLDRGLSGYVVCPLVEDSEEYPGRHSAESVYKELSEGIFKDYGVGLIHGKMKPKDKDAAMRDFAEGKTQLLVATTVIEVGIDVKNAAIMVIEDAESFGLSTLHQLRGRVGRGSEKSTCILLSDAKGDIARERLKTLAGNTDGFKIAEYDLTARGPGDFFGMRQHGLPQLKVASLADSMEELGDISREAAEFLKNNNLNDYPLLKNKIDEMLTVKAVL